MKGGINEIYDIIRLYEPKIKCFFQSKLLNREDIDDMVQETIFQIIKSIHDFKGKSAISTWIYGICRNTLYNHYYQKKKSNSIIDKLSDPLIRDEYEKVDMKIFLDKLEKPLYTIYNLYYINNLKIKEISGLLNKPEGSVKYLLYILRMKVREYFYGN
jgi:RNA polymerase sigma factor (sigma-70 family)